ncbi:hypothetical protein HK100_010650 [Physocladia obscura]|uniref:BZIP domain-containing protein n=1 Tax=Physocladia obscura TaxID=109957 RepID=A0AAD5T2T6_9FUNG|nr:hypothetical protein HK100_010650 [Physocladia obscura]
MSAITPTTKVQDTHNSKRTISRAADDFRSSDSGSDEANSGQREMEEPRKKPGRKMAQDEPPNERVARSREFGELKQFSVQAQRAFRERKANQVKELEEKVAQLSKLVEARGSSVAELELQQKVAKLESENSLLRQMTFNFDFFAQPSNTVAFPSPFAVANSAATLQQNSSIFGMPYPNNGSMDLNADILSLLNPSIPSPTSLATPASFSSSSGNGISDDIFAQLLSPSILNTTDATSLTSQSSSAATNTQSPSSSVNFTTFREPQQTVVPGPIGEDYDFLAALLKDDPESTETAAAGLTKCPSRPLNEMTEDERCAYVMAEIPALYETHIAVSKLPSLATKEDLVDELCSAFIQFTTKCTPEGDPVATTCPLNPAVTTDVDEKSLPPDVAKLFRAKNSILAVCDEEDSKKFLEIMEINRMKQMNVMGLT